MRKTRRDTRPFPIALLLEFPFPRGSSPAIEFKNYQAQAQQQQGRLSRFRHNRRARQRAAFARQVAEARVEVRAAPPIIGTARKERPVPPGLVRVVLADYARRHKSTTPGQGTRPTRRCRPRALTRRHFWRYV